MNLIRDFGANIPFGIIDFALVIVILALINVFVFWYIKRRFLCFTLLGFSLYVVLAYVLELNISLYASLTVVAILSLLGLIVNISDTRLLLDNKFTTRTSLFKSRKKSGRAKTYYSHEDFYKTIEKAVLYLSNNKIGALMTFEKEDSFDEICTNGTILNAPVTFELLITIFYPGTRLHDGAVVIRDNLILAASVFYKPSVESIGVKRGSRHRAALGISGETDAVTVVVSEETGKISIAVDGELTTYDQSDFYEAFVNIMEPKNIVKKSQFED